MPGRTSHLDRTFDTIIVGAGPAGCVLSSRLSEDAGRRVLLIEAGRDTPPGDEPAEVLDPFTLAPYNNSAFHWRGLLAEVGADLGHDSSRVIAPYVQAWGVGGASNINGAAVDRGHPDDYDEWSRLGADGWEWQCVLPYFKKLEHDLDFTGCRTAHGDNGPMPVRRLARSRWAPFCAAIGVALERRGFAFIEDYLTDVREGFSATPTNCLPDRRVSASMAYLTREVRRRPNLTILAGTRVDRVQFSGSRVSGVIASIDGILRVIKGAEVILCGGAIGSPTLLLRSGIGPREHLIKHGIEVIRHSPGVGANLQNHPAISVTTLLRRSAIQPADNPWLLQNWLRYSSGHADCTANDMHLMAFNKCDWHMLGRRIGLLAATVLKPYSRGCVELAGADPAVPPHIRFNLLADPRDADRLAQGARFALQLLTDAPVAGIRHEIFVANRALAANLTQCSRRNAFFAATLARAFDLGPLRRFLLRNARIDPDALLSDGQALRDLARRLARPQFHVCGTCRMGRADDEDAVVDSQGRVLGIKGLRVTDASIFPTIPRAYTHFPVIMVAERVADMIRLNLSGPARLAPDHLCVDRTAPEFR